MGGNGREWEGMGGNGREWEGNRAEGRKSNRLYDRAKVGIIGRLIDQRHEDMKINMHTDGME